MSSYTTEAAQADVLTITAAAGAAHGYSLLLASARAEATAAYVQLIGGNQSEAARRLGVDQAAINRMIHKDGVSLEGIDLGEAVGRLAELSAAAAAARARLQAVAAR